ncbi:hypothetical protein F4861DRAFT_174058 [Xylaria intraflava]|nr:hypothetical protein F4861DRAFT_174058 [Xylaria intraflava]
MASPGSLECPICQLPFADGHKPRHACPFCTGTFARADTAKRHARRCPYRDGQALPTIKRGRRLRACDACSRAKASCDAKTPCGRCSARSLTCTYKRLCDDPSHRPRHERSALPFLLKVTDPGLESITGVLICKEPERDSQGFSFPSDVSPATLSSVSSDLFFGYTGTSENGSLEIHGIDLGYSQYDEDIFGLMPLNIPNDSVTARLDRLVDDLRNMLCLKPKLREQFDRHGCARLFTAPNLQKYLKAFYCRRHYQLPLIHWATFDLETASNQLLLAAMLTGASYSRHDENSLNKDCHLNALYETAEKYIFKDLKSLFYSNYLDTPSKEQVQLCQAGLLMLGLKYDMNNGATVERITTKRLPILVKALRKMNLNKTRHDQASEWETFIYRETCIRLVTWTWSMDALDILIYNNPPLMTIAELSGQLPCAEALWDATSREEFEARKSNAVLYSDFLCLKTLVSGLLSEDWPEAVESSYGELTIYHLHNLVFGLQPILYNIHTGMLPATFSSVILRALDRWDSLWDKAIRRIPPDKLQWLGVCKNSREFSSLTRRIVEVFETAKGEQPRYLRRIPAADMTDIHQFIDEYCSIHTPRRQP